MNDGTHPAALDRVQLLADCEVRFSRRGGPGGQNRNKVETAAILRHRPTGLIAEANERRSQAENRAMALFRLRLLLALEVRCEPNGGEPSALWLSRVHGGRLAVNPEHDDFPAVLAEVLDHLAVAAWEPPAAAANLRVSGTQLVKLLRQEPRALGLVNARRQERGLRVLL